LGDVRNILTRKPSTPAVTCEVRENRNSAITLRGGTPTGGYPALMPAFAFLPLRRLCQNSSGWED
jgi:hypothetical protein